MHNSLTIQRKDPFPANKPYFDDTFRRKIAGPPPVLEKDRSAIKLTHHGYARLRGVGAISRHWSLDELSLSINDSVEGSATKPIERILCTTFNVAPDGDTLLLKNKDLSFRLSFESGARAHLEKGTRWTAYGEGEPATFIRVTTHAPLPWQGSIIVEKL